MSEKWCEECGRELMQDSEIGYDDGETLLCIDCNQEMEDMEGD